MLPVAAAVCLVAGFCSVACAFGGWRGPYLAPRHVHWLSPCPQLLKYKHLGRVRDRWRAGHRHHSQARIAVRHFVRQTMNSDRWSKIPFTLAVTVVMFVGSVELAARALSAGR
jgi:hypothetical protein